ncbi:dimethylarginine dimethylaminohydrolase family protein [Jeotgalibacillus proteolyticus]
MESKESNQVISCTNEYDRLERVLVCPPAFMKIEEPINETQKHFLDENINQEKAMEQHRNFIQALHSNGADVVQLPPINHFPEQVFTRDIGFTIDDTVFISTMGTKMRNGEEVVLQDWLEEMGIKHEKIETFAIEGGDVIVDGSIVWVGVSSRTTEEAIAELQSNLPEHKVIPVPFDSQFLHLDCLFNIISSDEALIYSKAFSKETVERFAEHYTLIEVNDGEQFTMGPNVLSLGDRTMLSLPVNKEINKELKLMGYKVIELDISEIIKSGGSFRCCSLPIKRG